MSAALLVLDTYFSQSVGARDDKALGRYLGQSFWSCLIVTVLSTASIALGVKIYTWLAAPGGTTEAVSAYIGTIIWCTPSIFFYFVLQRYWQARHRVLPFTVIIIAANALNLLACFAFGLGHFGFPRLGVKGIAVATVISRYAMLAAAAGFTWWHLRPPSLRWHRLDWGVQRDFLRLGLPAASHTPQQEAAHHRRQR